MGRYVARRLLQFIPVFLGATFLIHAMVFAIPGDPIRALFGDRPVAEATMQTLRDQYNLNDPLPLQYAKYLGGLVQGDLGADFRGRPVSTILGERIPVTLRLTATAFVIEILIGIAAGVLAGIRRGGFLDNLVLVSTTLLLSVPIFVLGYAAQLYFGVELGLLPISGLRAGWQSYLLPGFVLASLSMAYIARLLRTGLVEHLRADYVRTATAKGMGRGRVIGRHALRNSLIPVVTFLGADLGNLMAGAIITEGIFNIPGVGRAVFDAVLTQEGTVVVGLVTFLVLVYMVSNLVVDMLYAVLDPRIRYE